MILLSSLRKVLSTFELNTACGFGDQRAGAVLTTAVRLHLASYFRFNSFDVADAGPVRGLQRALGRLGIVEMIEAYLDVRIYDWHRCRIHSNQRYFCYHSKLTYKCIFCTYSFRSKGGGR